MIKLYRHALSGHSHRVELFLSLIGKDVELVDVELPKGEHKTDAFLKLNPFGQVPVIDDDRVIVADSNAILVYLAMNYADDDWYPHDPRAAAEIQQWLSVAAGPIAGGPGAARLVTVFGAALDHEWAKATAAALFEVMEKHLADRRFLLGDKPTVADVAAYSYIAHAPEGGLSLAPFAKIRAWLGRIEALPGFVPMQSTKAGLAA